MSSLIVNNITKIFGKPLKNKVNVLESASGEWEEGKIHAITGKNGAGKSTLLKIMCGLTTQDSGTVLIPPTLGPLGFKYKSKIAYLSPNGGLHPRLTIEENILSYKNICTNNKTYPIDIKSIISKLNLSAYMKAYPSDVSTGIIQKARIAQILGINPKVILLDEPTSGLDIDAKYHVYEILKELSTKNKIVLMATHDISEISGVCDSLSVVANGQIKQRHSVLDNISTKDSIDSIHNFIQAEMRP